MKLLILFSFFILVVRATTDGDLWLQFKQKHLKNYKSLKEESFRFTIFQGTLRIIEEHNVKYHKGEESYFLAINQFSDLTEEEFQKLYLGSRPPKTKIDNLENTFEEEPNKEVPKAVDWREKGVVSSVKDQKHCGACWAFSATAALESQNLMKHNVNLDLSIQELLDCSFNYGNFGCVGGWMNYAFAYIKENGIASEQNYPYKADDLDCIKNVSRANIKESGFKDIPAQNEAALTAAIATIGPISVAINATLIKHYGGGIFDNPNCSKELNHGVLAVGYGSLGDHEYYIIKNSWGKQWGEQGFVRMTRNKSNQCGIASKASYPIVD